MLYAIYCLDRSDGLQTRLDHYEAHRAYLETTPVSIVLAGPVAAADGETPIGSLMVVDVQNQEQATQFNQGDPFYQSGVWDRDTIAIHPFIKRRGWSEDY